MPAEVKRNAHSRFKNAHKSKNVHIQKKGCLQNRNDHSTFKRPYGNQIAPPRTAGSHIKTKTLSRTNPSNGFTDKIAKMVSSRCQGLSINRRGHAQNRRDRGQRNHLKTQSNHYFSNPTPSPKLKETPSR
jgi:hypothetical protein